MKRILALVLILSIAMALFTFTPMVFAENQPQNIDIAPTFVGTNLLNSPIQDGVEYYVNIKAPEKFASYGKVLVVAQENSILFKIDRTTLLAPMIFDEQKEHELKSITINPIHQTYGYVFLNYKIGSTGFETIIFRYKNELTTNPNKWIKKVGGFGEYFSERKIDANTALINNLNKGASNITYANNSIYVIENNSRSIWKIDDTSINKVNINSEDEWLLSHAEFFTISNNNDIYLYKKDFNGSIDTSVILKKNKEKDSRFVEVPFSNIKNLIDMKAKDNYIYLLTDSQLLKVDSSDFSKNLYDHNDAPSHSDKKFRAFDINTLDGKSYVSFALLGNDNISTYREVTNDDVITLQFFNHYGANCTCETPHQGWLNSPTEIAVTVDESTSYIIDSNRFGESRLVVLEKKIGNVYPDYTEYFYDATNLNLSSIEKIALDRQNNIYLSGNDELYIYSNNKNYEKDNIPLAREMEISGFDGKIVDMKMINKNTSSLYVLTDKNSVYLLSEGSKTPQLVNTFAEKITAISPSYDNTRIYVATQNTITSYPIGKIETANPLTKLVLNYEIQNFAVDYAGNIFVLGKHNEFSTYNKIGKNTYDLAQTFKRRKNEWENLNSFYVIPNTSALFFVDNALHIAEKLDNHSWGYSNERKKMGVEVKYDGDYLYVAKSINPTAMYKSRIPFGDSYAINYEIYNNVEPSEYFFVLGTSNDNKDMLIVVNSENEMGYIKSDKLTKVESTKDSPIGNNFVPLNGETTIFKYPYDNAPVITKTSNVMTFIDNVAFENGKNVWQNENTKWFHISFLTHENILLNGYVKMNEITKNTPITAPSTKIHLRVNTKAGETAKMYDMPDLASGIILDNIVNGTLVKLMQDEFDKEATFTKVQIELKNGDIKVGYILTKNLQENKFTTLQIVAVILTVITILITILVVVLILQLKKKRNNMNTFKKEE